MFGLNSPKSSGERSSLTLREMMLWCVTVSAVFASPAWLGEGSVMLSFYGSLIGVTWRLSGLIPFALALVCGLLTAIMLSAVMITLVFP